MKLRLILLALGILSGLQFARAAVLHGPVTNASNGHVYYLLAPDTWTASQAEAVSLGGHLVTINDAAENAWVAETFEEFGLVSRGLWIGLNDTALEGQYTWVSGETSDYRNWWVPEPIDPDGSWDYVHITWPSVTHPGQWRSRQNVSDYLGLPICGVVEVAPKQNPMVKIFPAIEIAWASQTNQVYQVQWAHLVNATEWFDLGAPVAGNGSTNSVFDSTRATAARFYRVVDAGSLQGDSR